MAAEDTYTVIILGGGPAGCATALALRRLGITRVLLVEASQYERLRVGESLPPDARLLFEALGIWKEFLNERHDACLGSCSSWGDDIPGYNDFLVNPYGNGWHLDRRNFDAFLARRAADCGVEVRTNRRFLDAAPETDGGFNLCLTHRAGGRECAKGRFVVDATGTTGRFVQMHGARKRIYDRFVCTTGFFDLPEDAGFPRLTLLEACEYGWWYAARLPQNRLAVAVATEPEILRVRGLHTPGGWLAHLWDTHLLARHLAGAKRSGDLLIRDVPSFLLDRSAGKDWLAVGDAASAFDPISSQGIYKSLAGGLLAAQVIAISLQGETGALERYQEMVTTSFTDYLHNRNYFYHLEQRWPSAPFWRHRQTNMTPVFLEHC